MKSKIICRMASGCNQAGWKLSHFAISVVVSASEHFYMEHSSLSGILYGCAQCSNAPVIPFMYSLKRRSQGGRFTWNGTFCFVTGTCTTRQYPGRHCLQQLSQFQHALPHAPGHCFEGDVVCPSETCRLPSPPLGPGYKALTPDFSSSRSKGAQSGSKQLLVSTEGTHTDTAT